MKCIFSFLSIALLFASCDPVCSSEIKNATTEDIRVVIEFDKRELEKSWGDRPYIPYLQSYPNNSIPGIRELGFDISTLTKTFKISTGASFPFETGIGSIPNYSIFRSLQILSADTLVFSGTKEITQAFEKTGKREWILIIE